MVLRHFQGSAPRTATRDTLVAGQAQHLPISKARFCLDSNEASGFLPSVTGFKSGRARVVLLSTSPCPAKLFRKEICTYL